jgi:EmrB/QacA subfamily drug resistance transporter
MLTKWRTLMAVSLASLLMLMGITMASVALPEIQRDLGASFNDLRWVIDAYALTLAATLLVSGSLADRIGRLRMFVIGLAIFAAGSLACAFASDTLALNIFRGVQGLGGAAMFATSLALIGAVYSGRDRHTALAFWGGTSAGAMAVGPLIGGLLIGAIGWEAIFLFNVPAALAVWMLVARGVPESRDPSVSGRPDFAGLVTIAGSMTLLVLGLFRGDDWGWGSSTTIGVFAGAAVLLLAFVVVELRVAKPLLDLALFRKASTIAASLGTHAVSFSVFAIFTFVALYLQSTLGHSAAGTGLRIFALTISSFVAAVIAGRLATRVSLRALFTTGLGLIGIGLLLMAVQIDAVSEWTALLAGGIVAGAGTGVALFAGSTVALGAAPQAQSGMAAGLNSMFRMLGLAMGVAALGTILEARTSDRLAELLPGLDSEAVVDLAATGNVELAAASAPAGLQGEVAVAAQTAFVAGLDAAMLVAALVALAGAALAFLLVRAGDLHHGPTPQDVAAS